MVNLPIYLQPGQVLIYGEGLATGSIQGIVPDNVDFVFGLVHQVWNYGNINASIGNSVMFNKKDAICRLAYANWNYTLIEQAKLVITEYDSLP